jgi:hypothetical protein
MSNTTSKERRKTSNKNLDIFVVIFCLSGAIASLYFFYKDITATFSSSNISVGDVTVKKNTVERQMAERGDWDMLFTKSPVYLGDIVRTARKSDATLNIVEKDNILGENTIINLKQNTLIRIQKNEINLFNGNADISSGAGVVLSTRNQVVRIAPGSVINAISGDDGLVLRVTEGVAQIIRDGQARDVAAGEIIVQDADGDEVWWPIASVIHPKPNANFLKTEAGPLNVEFNWKRINMLPQDRIRLEIAEDKNFKRIIQTIGNLDSNATASVNTGVWHWRLLHEDTTLASGRMSVTEVSAPALLAPSTGDPSQIPVKFAGQEVQFRWAEVPDAAYYKLQISKSPEFIVPEINLQIQTTNYISSNISVGTWYWRVLPVFSSAYEGEARFSQVSSFQVQPVVVAASPVVDENTHIVGEEEKSPEGDFLALREQTKQIWQEQQAQQELREQLRQSSQTQTQQTSQVSSTQQQQTRQTQQQPLRLILLSPQQNVIIPGLTALRQPTVFRWTTDEDMEFSRFVLSRRANPVSGRPEIDIQNPGRAVSVPRLAEGVWYWTVEGRSRDGRSVTAASPRQIRVQQIPLLPAPGNRLPEAGFSIGAEELRQKESIVFSWSRVEGANSYILSILKDGFPRRQQILQTEPIIESTYTFDNYSLFDESGTFYWQVEAVYYRDGILEQRGTPGENKFIFDVPRPGRVRTRTTGVLYGR